MLSVREKERETDEKTEGVCESKLHRDRQRQTELVGVSKRKTERQRETERETDR